MYYKLIDPAFWLYLILFLIAAVTSWIIPGWVTLTFLKLKSASLKLALSLPIGIAFWGLQAYVLGYTHLRFLTYGYLAIWLGLCIYQFRSSFRQELSEILSTLKRQPLWLWLLMLASVIFQVVGDIGSGFLTADGLKFYFVNAADGIMHLSYIQELKTTFPPFEPGSVGQPLANYHYWSDLILADISRIWGIPIIHLFFQYAPILLAVWTTVMLVMLLKMFGGKAQVLLTGLFLLTFGADAAFIITEYLHHTGADKVASLDSGVTFFFNFPQVVARVLFMAVMMLLIKLHQTKKLAFGLLAAILIATLFGFKIYYGIFALFGFGWLTLADMVAAFWSERTKQAWPHAFKTTLTAYVKQCALLVVALIIALSIYLPANKGAGGLTFSFFEWPHHMLSFDNLDYQDWWLRMQVYQAAHNYRNLIIYNLVALLITFVAIYGTRLLGFWPVAFLKKSVLNRKLGWFLIPADILFILIGLLTYQNAGVLNIYNFLIVPIFSFNIFAAFTLGELKTKWFIPAFMILAIFTLPRPLSQLTQFFNRYRSGQADLILSPSELAAYSYLQTHTQASDIVQALPTNKTDLITPYVAFMSDRPSYIAGEMMLESHNQPTKERQFALKNALAVENRQQRDQALQALGIKYLILRPEELAGLGYHESDTVFMSATTAIVAIN